MISENKQSPNFDKRAGGAAPSLLILHYTGMRSAGEALERLCDPDSKVSAHYFIDEDGAIIQLIDDNKRAWHAGVSCWAGETDINSHSIGIELVNPGHEFGYQDFPEDQVRALIGLCRDLMKKYSILASGVLAHSDVAPERKTDPGEKFPWKHLAREGIGLWPDLQAMDFQAAEDLIGNEGALQDLFSELGYNPAAGFEKVLTAFYRRYVPERFENSSPSEELDILGTARLLALVRAAHDAKT